VVEVEAQIEHLAWVAMVELQVELLVVMVEVQVPQGHHRIHHLQAHHHSIVVEQQQVEEEVVEEEE
jgi:hypothetical protein